MDVWEKTKVILFGVRLSKSVIKHFPATPYKTVSLHTPDGLRLEGWSIPAKNPKGTVILYHGYGGSKDPMLSEAAYFHQLGYNTFLLDFRASGNSDGSTCTIGYREAQDVKLAYDYVKSCGEKHIVFWGMSMGAAAILKAIPQYDLRPENVILECPFATLTDAVKARMRAVHLPGTPFSQLLTFWGGVELGFWGPGYKPEQYAKKLSMPVLLCWGRHDPRVYKSETDIIFKHLGTTDKTLVIFENSGHQSFCRNEGEKWKNTVRTFLQ